MQVEKHAPGPRSALPVHELAADLRRERVLELIGTEPEREFHDIAELAASLCSTPISLVTMLDTRTQHHKGLFGCRWSSMPRGETFCEYTLKQDGILVISDPQADSRFSKHELVAREPGIRFYAGVPIHEPGWEKMGALCVIDTVRRELKTWQSRALQLLARQVNARIELRVRRRELELALESAVKSDSFFTAFAESLPFSCYLKDKEHRLLFYNHALAEKFGVSRQEWLGRTSFDLWPPAVAECIQASEEKVFATGQSAELPVQVPGLCGGSPVDVTLHQVLCPVPGGEPVLAVVMLRTGREPNPQG